MESSSTAAVGRRRWSLDVIPSSTIDFGDLLSMPSAPEPSFSGADLFDSGLETLSSSTIDFGGALSMTSAPEPSFSGADLFDSGLEPLPSSPIEFDEPLVAPSVPEPEPVPAPEPAPEPVPEPELVDEPAHFVLDFHFDASDEAPVTDPEPAVEVLPSSPIEFEEPLAAPSVPEPTPSLASIAPTTTEVSDVNVSGEVRQETPDAVDRARDEMNGTASPANTNTMETGVTVRRGTETGNGDSTIFAGSETTVTGSGDPSGDSASISVGHDNVNEVEREFVAEGEVQPRVTGSATSSRGWSGTAEWGTNEVTVEGTVGTANSAGIEADKTFGNDHASVSGQGRVEGVANAQLSGTLDASPDGFEAAVNAETCLCLRANGSVTAQAAGLSVTPQAGVSWGWGYTWTSSVGCTSGRCAAEVRAGATVGPGVTGGVGVGFDMNQFASTAEEMKAWYDVIVGNTPPPEPPPPSPPFR